MALTETEEFELLSLKRKRGAAAQPEAAPEITTGQAALRAVGETLREDVPVLGRVAQAVREDIPGFIAEKGGALGIPKTAAAIGTAIGTVGELIPRTGAELALTGAAKPIAAAGKALGRTVLPKLTSFLTRIELPIVERAIGRAKELGRKELLAPEAVEKAIASLGEGIKAARHALGEKLGVIEDAVAEKTTATINPWGIKGALVAKLRGAGFNVGGKATGAVKRKLNAGVNDILKDLGLGGKPAPMSFRDAVNLRRKIDDTVSFDNAKLLGLDNTQQALLKGARRELNEQIRAVSPRYRRATDAFASAARTYDELSKDVLSGKPETIQRRITGMFNKGSAERKIVEKVDRISEKAGASLDTILDSITAQRFAPVLNPTVERAAFQSGGGILGASGLGGAAGAMAAMGRPELLLGGGALLSATSPRLHGLGIRALASPVGPGQIPGLSTSAVATLLAALRARRQSPLEEAVETARRARR